MLSVVVVAFNSGRDPSASIGIAIGLPCVVPSADEVSLPSDVKSLASGLCEFMLYVAIIGHIIQMLCSIAFRFIWFIRLSASTNKIALLSLKACTAALHPAR